MHTWLRYAGESRTAPLPRRRSANLRRAGVFLVLAVFPWSLNGADFRIPIEVDTGFYDREGALAAAALEFPCAIDLRSLVLRTADSDREVPAYFAPQGRHRGALYWHIGAKVDALTTLRYHVQFSEGQWRAEPTGSSEVAALVKERCNPVPNASFELASEAPTDRKREGRPGATGWRLLDHRGRCDVSDEQAHDGVRSLKLLSGRQREQFTHALAFSDPFPLKPSTRYTLSYYVNIAEKTGGKGRHQCVDVQLEFLNEHQRSVAPQQYAINRLQLVFRTAARPPDAYIGRWIKASRAKTTTDNTAYGRVRVHTSQFAGTAYVDSIVVAEQTYGEPMKVTVGEAEAIGAKR